MAVAPIPFTPSHYSVNRVRVVDLPGIRMDEEVRGQQAYDLVSVRGLARYARGLATQLQLPGVFLEDSAETREGLPRFIQASLSSTDEGVRAAAEAVVQRTGRNLGHVLLALQRGDQVNREARGDWKDADWQRWATIKRVWLAGGLTSGQLGAGILRHACEWLAEAGAHDAVDVRISPFEGATSLIGAARFLPARAGHALCFDFGQTSAKRAIVSLDDDAITLLSLLPPVPLFGPWPLPAEPDVTSAAPRYRDFMVDTICDTLATARAEGNTLSPDIMLCVAAYVDGGRLLGNGSYATLMHLATDARPMLAGAVTARTGHACRVHLIHDGTAAAAVYAGEQDTAIIALGTALGVGFAPASAGGLRPIRLPWRNDDRGR